MDEAAARELLATFRPDLSTEPIRLIDEGWEFLALAIGADLIARFPRRPAATWNLAVEIRLLPVIASALPVPVPVAEFVGRREGAPLFSICRRIAGAPLDTEAMGVIDVGRTAADLARSLSALHAIPVEGLRRTGLAIFDVLRWRAAYAGFARRIADGPVSERDEAVARRLAAAIGSFLAREELFRFEPALIHADLGEQFFVEAPSGRVTGIIDWADAVVGDPAHDFGGLLEYGGGFVESVMAGYGTEDAGFLERARFYDSMSSVVGFLGATEIGHRRGAEICWVETTLRWG